MYSLTSDGRVQINGSLTTDEITELLKNKKLQVIQFSSDIEPETFTKLNETLFSNRSDVILRVYGYYQTVCDLSFLHLLPNLRRLYVECHDRVENVETLASLKNLAELNLSIFSLESFEVLSLVPDGLHKLMLGQTKSKKQSLSAIERFKDLEELLIVGHTKDIEIVGKLMNIEKITLTSITTSDLEFLKPLKKLSHLSINFGGIKTFNAIAGMDGLKYLELFQIRGLSDISFISSLTGLQYVTIENLPNVKIFPSLVDLHKLRKLALNNLKGLKELNSLEYAPALEVFTHWSAMNMSVEDYLPALRNPSLKRISVGFGSDKRNKQFEELAEKYGKTDKGVLDAFVFE
ncbi:leucine-rich repeat domain-containing protein [Mesobacillus jeotgali]|uniref:hypothetical protein n=1 Tax=Mesobacillus jeotgali TaxID=129985 RepID=UPI001CFE577C|nr:hypothetical protein [Mesobacillus jeotgali]